MTTKTKPPCQTVKIWVRARLGRECFSPFTGQDSVAFDAWVHLLELYFRSDAEGQRYAIEALRSVLHAMQRVCWPVAKAAIPGVGDWVHEEEIWGKVCDEAKPLTSAELRASLEQWQFSTLRCYIEALGGKLELFAVMPHGHRISLAPSEDGKDPVLHFLDTAPEDG